MDMAARFAHAAVVTASLVEAFQQGTTALFMPCIVPAQASCCVSLREDKLHYTQQHRMPGKVPGYSLVELP